jgi:hypothetical protein
VSWERLRVAPAVAYRLAFETVVAPVTVRETEEPLAVRDPPVIANPPLIVELAATVSPPPEMVNGSAAVMLWTDSTFELIVTVGLAPETLMTTSSDGPGTASVLQLLATSQEPLVLLVQVTIDKSWRGSRISITGCRRLSRLETTLFPRRNREERY